MAITTYAELQTALANWLDRSDLTSRIPEFIALAEAQMNRMLRDRNQQSVSNASVSTEYFSLPTDFAEAIDLTVVLNGVSQSLSLTDTATIAAQKAPTSFTSWPRYYAIVGTQAQLYPAPDTTYNATLTYITRVPALTNSNTSNWVLVGAPDAYLYGAQAQAAVYLRDPEMLAAAGGMFRESMAELMRDRAQVFGALRTDVHTRLGGMRYNINADW